MQKKLIALAIAGFASTAAMAQVTVYGRIDTSYASTDTDTTTAAGVTTTKKETTSGLGTGALTTSRLGFTASEDLGDGLTAKANLELGISNTAASAATTAATTAYGTGADNGTDIGANTGTSFVTRLANVGLAGSFGEITLGRQNVLVDLVWQAGNAGGSNNAVGTAYNDGIKFNNVRASELVTYSSPTFSGFKFGLQYATGETDAAGVVAEHTETGLALMYTAGALNVNLGYSTEEQTTANLVTAEPEQLVVSGSYDFGVAKLYASYADGENVVNGNGSSREVIEVGVKVPLGKVTLLGSFYQGEIDNVAAAPAVAAADRDLAGLQFGALYSFSKRTTAYFLYGMNESESQVSSDNVEKNQFALGLRHDF